MSDPDYWDETDHDLLTAIVIGNLGHGSLMLHTSGYPSDDLLSRLARTGPCFSVIWSDFCPAAATLFRQEGDYISFNYISWDCLLDPDEASVESWIQATPPGTQGWLGHRKVAILLTGESLCGGVIDESWMAAEHAVFPIWEEETEDDG
ncbi:hypothetical protein [Rhizohabitans arisaemae]|uniref:hypothetical protein n=1 Tax=Rhizohabitans arisaemae TaxID=2720610 RepID=UPI0024B1F063|nr:hypothetical protein [Rhizohabitans arisaemae]